MIFIFPQYGPAGRAPASTVYIYVCQDGTIVRFNPLSKKKNCDR